MYVNGHHVATESGMSKKEARTLAATKAVSELSKYCYTIKVIVCPTFLMTYVSVIIIFIY